MGCWTRPAPATTPKAQVALQADQPARADDAPWIFIYHPVTIELHTPKVKGFVLIADGIQRYATVWKSQ